MIRTVIDFLCVAVFVSGMLVLAVLAQTMIHGG